MIIVVASAVNALLVMPMSVCAMLYMFWPFADMLCRGSLTLQLAPQLAIIICHLALALDRRHRRRDESMTGACGACTRANDATSIDVPFSLDKPIICILMAIGVLAGVLLVSVPLSKFVEVYNMRVYFTKLSACAPVYTHSVEYHTGDSLQLCLVLSKNQVDHLNTFIFFAGFLLPLTYTIFVHLRCRQLDENLAIGMNVYAQAVHTCSYRNGTENRVRSTGNGGGGK
jgi:hypothetical protein